MSFVTAILPKHCKQLSAIFCCSLLLASTPALSTQAVIKTNLGEMTFQLHDQHTPETTANFIRLAQSGWYQGKTFYRVVPGHVAQAGINDDKHPDMKTYQVKAEFSDQLPQIKGSLGLARGEDPNSGSTEFYICLERRAHLDGKYTNFGQLIAGEAVLDKIAAVQTEEKWIENPGGKPIAFHQPKTSIVIEKITILP
jgi:cyclophilin family peptidyl-prolyl cis-trans isomerase